MSANDIQALVAAIRRRLRSAMPSWKCCPTTFRCLITFPIGSTADRFSPTISMVDDDPV